MIFNNEKIWFVGIPDNKEIKNFIEQGIWYHHKNNDKKSLELVNSIAVGSKIILKSSYTKKRNLPFNNYDQNVSVLRIIAVGEVVGNKGDGINLSITWKELQPPKEWYGTWLSQTIQYIENQYFDLLDFIFNDKPQNYQELEKNYYERSLKVENKVNNMSNMDNDTKENNNIWTDKNIILYGPPGTGKTYNSKRYAIAIIENITLDEVNHKYNSNKLVNDQYNKYVDNDSIRFITFHQSYSYEDFIEGIKPIPQDNGTLSYNVTNGVFKDFCLNASSSKISEKNIDILTNDNPQVWKVSLEKARENQTRTYCLLNGCIRIGWDEYGENLEFCNGESYQGKESLKYFIDEMEIGDIVLSCYDALHMDAIGIVTGEYKWYNDFKELKRLRKVKWLVKNIREEIKPINSNKQFTTQAVYRLNISIDKIYSIVNKYNKEINIKKEQGNKVFIIDEINRGNVSKIFGELITLIENDKRQGEENELKAVLPYSKTEFSIPTNVYILGTMNTADRSIISIDTALRRRFNFIELMPKDEIISNIYVDGLSIKDIFNCINNRIKVLYDREHQIGQSYFIALKINPTIEVLAQIFKNKIIPLLQEYFYEDYEKIRLVLADNQKDKAFQFIQINENDLSKLFGDNLDIDLSKDYILNEQAFYDINSYKGILGKFNEK